MGMFRNKKQIDRKIATGRRLGRESRKKEVVHGWSCIYFASSGRRSESCGAKLSQDQPHSFYVQPSPDTKHDLPLSSIAITACGLCHTVDAARGISRFLTRVQGSICQVEMCRTREVERVTCPEPTRSLCSLTINESRILESQDLVFRALADSWVDGRRKDQVPSLLPLTIFLGIFAFILR